jgi:uncharacterized protein YjlB
MDERHFLLTPRFWVPNNARLPVILYRGALTAPSAEAFEALFARNGWLRNGATGSTISTITMPPRMRRSASRAERRG